MIDWGSHDGADSIELAKLFKTATIQIFALSTGTG